MRIFRYMYESGIRTSLLERMFVTEKKVSYTKNLVLGSYDYPYNEDLFTINFSRTKRILILGGTGAGKSFLARSLWNRAYMAGITPVIMTDIKPEHYTSQYPLQENFRKFLFKEEKPITIPMSVYYPSFLHKITGLDLPNQKICKLSVSSIVPTDLMAFVDYENLSLTMRMELEDLVATLMKEDVKFTTIDEIIEYIDNKEITPSVKNRLIKSFRNLKELGIFGGEDESFDYIKDIKEGKVVDFNIFGWQRVDMKRYMSLFLAILIRDLLSSKMMKRLEASRHLLLFFEELHAFCPRGRRISKAEEISRSEIIRAVNMGRSEKISFLFVTQDPNNIDPTILSQVDYILIGRKFERRKLMDLMRDYIPDYSDYTPYEFGRRVSELIGSLRKWKDGAREWICIKKGEEPRTFVPFAPLTYHKEEGETL